VRGSLNREIIRRIVRRHINELRFCYERELQARPDLSGRVVIQFTIAATGQVVASVVQQSTLRHAAVEGCIALAVRRWLFPRPSDGGIVIVSYPFVLSAVGAEPPRGPARLVYTTVHGLQLELKGEDSVGRRATRQVSLQAELAKLLVATDRAFYKPGETARLGIQAVPQFTAALIEGVREGQTVLRSRVELRDGKGTAELDLPAGVAGTLRLDVVGVDPYDVRSPAVSRQIVIAEPQGLVVKATTDSASYRPAGRPSSASR